VVGTRPRFVPFQPEGSHGGVSCRAAKEPQDAKDTESIEAATQDEASQSSRRSLRRSELLPSCRAGMRASWSLCLDSWSAATQLSHPHTSQLRDRVGSIGSWTPEPLGDGNLRRARPVSVRPDHAGNGMSQVASIKNKKPFPTGTTPRWNQPLRFSNPIEEFSEMPPTHPKIAAASRR
jgi:hypothetical protein